MQRLKVSCAVRLIYTSLGAKVLNGHVSKSNDWTVIIWKGHTTKEPE